MINMNTEFLNSILEAMGHEFDTFANALAKGTIAELAPPFSDYSIFDGNLIEYYKVFFQKYQKYLDSINDKTWLFVNSFMHKFIERNGGYDVEFNLQEESQLLMFTIVECLKAYYNGSPSSAYKKMEELFFANESHLLLLLPQIQYNGCLYRVRNKRGLTTPKDLFHTPFEERTKCGSYRFSILGYPSLYLSGSLETSLKESRIEDLNYSAICFKNKKTVKCIDLTLPNMELSFWERYSFVLFYPLIMACGLKVREEGHAFKPEYVIPQLLFQVISKQPDFMGVSYTSTRSERPDYRNGKQRNFVLKVPGADNPYGQSKELASIFECTMPISPDENEHIKDIELKFRNSQFVSVLR